MYKGGVAFADHGASRLVRQPKEKVLPNPVFTHSEEAKLKKYVFTFIVTAFYIGAEAVLYQLVSSSYVPGGSQLLRSGLALFLSALGAHGMYLGYSSKLNYLYAQSIQDELTEFELTEFREKYIWGSIAAMLSLIGIIAGGLARIYYLETIPADGLSPERLQAVIMTGRATAVFTMAVGLSCGVILASQKHEQARLSELFARHLKWRRTLARQDRYNESISRLAVEMLSVIDELIEKAWQELVKMKGDLKTEDEHDARYAAMSQEYEALMATPGFVITDAVYARFSAIASTCEQLFKYGLYSAPGIQKKIAIAEDALKLVESRVDDRTPEFMKPKPVTTDENISWHKKNGSATSGACVAITIGFLLALGSCTKEAKPTPVAVLIDLSGSRDTGVVQWYGSLISTTVFPALSQKQSITVHPVDYGSQTFDEEIYRKDFAANVYINEYDGLQQEKLAQHRHSDSIRSATAGFEKAFDKAYKARTPYRNGTDILGALIHVREYVHDSGLLVILSDMLQATDKVHIDLEVEECKPADYPRLLAKMGHADLKGMRVIVITGEQASMPPAKYTNVKGLWQAYFKASGASLVSYSSGSSAAIIQELNNHNEL